MDDELGQDAKQEIQARTNSAIIYHGGVVDSIFVLAHCSCHAKDRPFPPEFESEPRSFEYVECRQSILVALEKEQRRYLYGQCPACRETHVFLHKRKQPVF